jgi:transmembrane sensor
MSSTRLSYLLDRYMQQSSTPEEKMELMILVKNAGNDEELLSILKECWKTLPVTEKLGSVESAEILSNILSSDQLEAVEVVLPSRSFTWLKIAAAVAVIAVASLLLIDLPTFKQIVAVAPTVVKRTAHRFIRLPDGTTVILKGNSKLSYKKNLAGPKREIYLVGEGYFDVKHDASREFIIHTGQIKTTVLGTAFEIKAIAGEDKVMVTVTRGKVKVSNNRQVYGVITPNQQLVCNINNDQYLHTEVNAKAVVSWKDDDLYFDDVTISEISRTLEERFNIHILFANEAIKHCRLSATFFKTQSLSQVLEVIRQFNQVDYTYTDKNTVLLSGMGCN